jgi:prepilin-type N-terminal cleavage/methylation domain-containing protein
MTNSTQRLRQSGFTLLELIIGLAIGGLLIAAIGTTTSRLIIENMRVRNHTLAIRQVQNAGYWITRDAVGAQTIVADDNPFTSDFLTLRWNDWNSLSYETVYYFDGGQLHRRYTSGAGEVEELIVASNIDPESTAFEAIGTSWLLTITSTIDGFPAPVTEIRCYSILPRPHQVQGGG